jgi:hypothetical protein
LYIHYHIEAFILYKLETQYDFPTVSGDFLAIETSRNATMNTACQLDMPTLPLPHSLQPSPVSQHRQVEAPAETVKERGLKKHPNMGDLPSGNLLHSY